MSFKVRAEYKTLVSVYLIKINHAVSPFFLIPLFGPAPISLALSHSERNARKLKFELENISKFTAPHTMQHEYFCQNQYWKCNVDNIIDRLDDRNSKEN